MVISKGVEAESVMGWRQSWEGFSAGVGDGMAVDFGRRQQRSRRWGSSGFR